MISDSHLHTNFSTDSKASPESVAEAAIAKGMNSICITDHYDPEYPTGGFMIDPERYWDTMEKLRENYRGKLEIRIGLEMGLLPDLHDEILAIEESFPFDFVIGSVHVMDGFDPYYRDQFKGTDEEMYRRYFEVMLEDLDRTEGYQSLGHLDYVVRYGEHLDEEYSFGAMQDLIDPILRKIIDRGIALEVNTGNLIKGMSFPNPHPDVIRRYLELGGDMITIGSDAHRPEDLGYGFPETVSMLKEFGVGQIAEFRGKKPSFVRI